MIFRRSPVSRLTAYPGNQPIPSPVPSANPSFPTDCAFLNENALAPPCVKAGSFPNSITGHLVHLDWSLVNTISTEAKLFISLDIILTNFDGFHSLMLE